MLRKEAKIFFHAQKGGKKTFSGSEKTVNVFSCSEKRQNYLLYCAHKVLLRSNCTLKNSKLQAKQVKFQANSVEVQAKLLEIQAKFVKFQAKFLECVQ